MKSLYRLSSFVLIVILLLILTSISAVAQEPVTIEWWTVASEEFDEEVQRALVDKFNAEHPDIQVNMTLLPPDGYDERMQTTLGAGQGAPDVALFWNTNWYPQALDLTEFIEADENIDPEMYLPGFWNTRVVFKDEIIGLPLGVGANFVMYNKDMFDAAGIPYPEADWTVQEYNELVSQLSNPDARVWGGDRPRGPYRAIFYNMGARLYSDDSTTTEGYLNSPESVAAYQWLADLVATDGTPTPADLEVLGTEGTGPIDLFLADRLAMATLNQGHMQNAIAAGKNFGIVPEPTVEGAETRHVNAWSLTASVWEGTEHPEEAYTWLSYWAGPEGQRFLMENGNLIPSIPDVLEDWEAADTDYGQAFLEVLELEQVAAWDNAHPCKGTVLRAVQDAWDLVNLGQISGDEIQTTLDGLVPAADAALEECVERLGA
jgi:multiple sugar transport system substrate-binding protein